MTHAHKVASQLKGKFRIIVRGTQGKRYVRRTKIVNGTYYDAAKLADAQFNKLTKGLKAAFINIKPLPMNG